MAIVCMSSLTPFRVDDAVYEVKNVPTADTTIVL